MGLTDSLIHHSSFRALDAAMSDNLQLPYKYNGHHSPDGHRVEMVIIVKMDIMVRMVIMVEIVITLQDKMAYTHPLATPPITSNKLYIGTVHFEGYI